jgi:hypothetical protein
VPSSTMRVWILLGAVVAGATGCGQVVPQPSDPVVGRDTLSRVLDAWKRGDSLDAYKVASPAVTVVNRPWKQGVKLIEYEIEGAGEPNGFDVQYTVRLSLQDSAGKQSKEKALYVVSTSPRLVVIHTEAGG